MLWILLSILFLNVQGKTHEIVWRSDSPKSLEVDVGDKINFTFSGGHNVWKKLTDECKNYTTVGSADGPYVYNVTVEDSGKTFWFACSKTGHCPTMNMKVSVNEMTTTTTTVAPMVKLFDMCNFEQCENWECSKWCECSEKILYMTAQKCKQNCKCSWQNSTLSEEIASMTQSLTEWSTWRAEAPQDDKVNAETVINNTKNLLEKLKQEFDRQEENSRQFEICCQAQIASCLACKEQKSVDEYCDDHPDTQGCPTKVCTTYMKKCDDGTLVGRDSNCTFRDCPAPTCDGKCTTWFDGCNRCKCNADGQKTCTEQFCAQPRKPVCLDQYNCYTREQWSPHKREWCCAEKEIGCSTGGYNCSTGDTWSDAKRAWCCKHNGIGCSCPKGCTTWFDGCNTCTCNEGQLEDCTKKYCFRQERPRCKDIPCAVVDCAPGYTKYGADDNECGGKCAKYNCHARETWSREKRAWCCIHEGRGCCPQVRCASPKPGCNRTWVQDINNYGCLLYPCGKDECPTRSVTQPQIIIKDSRDVERLRVEEDNNNTKVTIQIMDTKSRPRVSLGNQQITMVSNDDIVRRRNIIRAIVDMVDGSVMNVSKAGLPATMTRRLKAQNITDIMFAKTRPKNNTSDCTEADIDLKRDDNNRMAIEIVFDKTGDQSLKCFEGRPLSLLTLQTPTSQRRRLDSHDTTVKYELQCMKNDTWNSAGTYDIGDDFEECSGVQSVITSSGVASSTEAPSTEAPSTEAPSTEAPSTEAPSTEAPSTEAPTTEAPTTEAPSTEAPSTEAPSTEAPSTEAPSTEAPQVPIDCQGGFSACASNCTRSYLITRPAMYGGANCTHVTGHSEFCSACAPGTHVVFEVGSPKRISSCYGVNLTVIWNGTHNLIETPNATCSRSENDTEWYGEHSTSYKITSQNLGGKYPGHTRYYMCDVGDHCERGARFEVYCPPEVDPNRRVTVNSTTAQLEMPALLVALCITGGLTLLLAMFMCPRRKKTTAYIAVDTEEPLEIKKYKPLKWVP